MRNIELTIGGEKIPFHYGNDCFDEICHRLASYETDCFIVVTDDRVRDLYGPRLLNALDSLAPSLILSSPQGESSKDFGTLATYSEKAFASGATRRSVVVTLGGGVPGNLGGLLAALLFRGIRLIHIPTTLIGALDSVVSLKQAINSRSGKNLLGTFYRPEAIFVDTGLFETLPEREVRAGICEIIKNALSIHPHLVDPLRDFLTPDCKYSAATFEFLLKASIEAKLEVMAHDKFEKGRGLILEYGHTIGHAVELADCYNTGQGSISHGEAIGIGMIGAAQLAAEFCGLDALAVETHYDLLRRAGSSLRLPPRVSPEKVMRLVRFDNKRGYRIESPDYINMILLRRLGEPFGNDQMPLTAVPIAKVGSVIESLSSS